MSLVGAHGIGKSQIVGEVAATLNAGFRSLQLVFADSAAELCGLEYVDGDVTRLARPAWFPTEPGPGIVFCDEANRASESVLAALYSLTTTGELGQHRLPPGWIVVVAGNPAGEDYHVRPLDPALRSRFVEVQVVADRDVWLRFAEQRQFHPAVREMVADDADAWRRTPPRSWEQASRILVGHEAQPLEEPVLRALLHGVLEAPFLVDNLLVRLADPGALVHDPVHVLRTYAGDMTIEGGARDLIDQVVDELVTIVEGRRMGELVETGVLRVEHFDRFLADLPGDQRLRLQEALCRAKAAAGFASAIGFDTAEVFSDTFEASSTFGRVTVWADDPDRLHYLGIGVQAVVRELGGGPIPGLHGLVVFLRLLHRSAPSLLDPVPRRVRRLLRTRS